MFTFSTSRVNKVNKEQNMDLELNSKRLPESPVNDLHKKSKMSQESELLGALRQMMKEELANMRKDFSEELDSKLDNFASKDEIQKINSELETVHKELSSVKADLQAKEDENNQYKELLSNCTQRIIQLEKVAKGKNVIFSNIVTDNDALTTAKKICQESFGMEDHLNDIERASILRTFNGKSSIIVEFTKKSCVDHIFSGVGNLKGQSLSVQRDLTKEDLAIKKLLMTLKHNLKKSNPTVKVTVYDTKIKIGSCKFNYLNGSLSGNGVDGREFLKNTLNFDFEDFINRETVK